ncbi:MAG: undecaprenyl/decaprenyl-phosphate alpha-N-acetylglucosaminyl 1-phosphate transferase [Chloroflexi bacterium]|nr:undecaprenyl/decaprenyl-phosphate alpha-N-acetylglucosaminyl 1-phosphate transferase [Chloroflexota bacterium]
MSAYMLIFVAALVLAIGATPVVRRLALHAGVVDIPSTRKIHSNPVPLLGGAAIYAAVIIAIFVFSDRFNLSQFLGIVLGASLISFLGIWDDSRGLRPAVKLTGQVAAAVLLIATGVQVELVAQPWVNYAITIVWVAGITNAMNLLDNMDGLSGGIAAVASAFFFLLAAMSGQYLVASLAIALLGACLGFLRYNFNPASIFMGDGGSLFLGFLLAALGIKLRFGNVPTITWMIPIIVLGVPIFDTTLVTISRLRRGMNPLTTPGRDHVSHRMVAMGMTRREAVLTLYLFCGGFGMIAMLVSQMRTLGEAYVVAAVIVVAAVAALVKLESIDFEGRQKKSNSSRKA